MESNDGIARAKVHEMKSPGPGRLHVSDAQDESEPDVPSADELFCDDALERLQCSEELDKLVGKLRAREQDVARQAERAGQDELLRFYEGIIATDLSVAGITLPDTTYDSTASLFEAVVALPFTPKSAPIRRKVREIARVAMLHDDGSLRVPERADDLHALWEQAMIKEPRWSADFPSSDFRSSDVVIRGAKPERKVVHRCMPASEVPIWLNRLIGLLADERLEPEVRAACGLCLHDWIHPFLDGNGHTGRLLMITVLEALYSQPTLVCFARELVVHRATTMKLFKQLRNRESDIIDFCIGLLGQLAKCQMPGQMPGEMSGVG